MGKLTAQQEKASELHGHLLVTANAGSGKTKVLSGRYIKALLEENVRVNEIAAITYTDKAASELFAKIRKELVALHDATTDKTEKVKIDGLIKDLINSNISTIHSFCSSLLREYPVEAGIDPSFNLIAKSEGTQLVTEATTEIIAESLADPEISPEIKKIIRLYQSTSSFKGAILEMINGRKKIKTYTAQLDGDLSPENILKKNLVRTGELINTLFPTLDDLVGKIRDVNNFVLEQTGSATAAEAVPVIENYFNTIDPVDRYVSLCKLMGTISTKKGDSILNRGYLTNNLRDRLDNTALSDLITLHSHLIKFFKPDKEADAEYAKRLLAFHAEYSSLLLKYYNLINARYTSKKNALNCIDFEDMLLLAADILGNPAVKRSLAGKFKYIMIDEYQDTNDLQLDIFLPLLNDLSVGNLYVVGDKKQSIYGFRDADLNVFDRTREKIEGNAGDSVTLGHTFRLTRELTAFVNHIFPAVFSSMVPLLDGKKEQFTKKRRITNAVEYEETLFFDIDKTYTESNIGLILNRVNDGKVDTLRTQEAEMLAAHLKEHFKELEERSKTEKEPLTIAILTRHRKNFEFLEKALAALDIPYELMGGKQFYQQQVVSDIALVFNFLSDPADDLSLYALLRSPFFSLSDADILEISNVDLPTAFEKLGFIAVPQSGRKRFAFETLNELILLSAEVRPHRVIDFMLSRTPYLAVMSAGPGGKQNLANIRKLVTQSVAFDNFRFNSIHDFREWLSDLILKEDQESQEAPFSDSENSVKLMTIHQAKGLEFTSVYLFGCGDSADGSHGNNKVDLALHKDLGLIFKVSETGDIFFSNVPTIHYDMAKYLKSQVELEEAKRVFYVAVTRAANNLFISASVKTNNVAKNSFLEMLMNGLGWESLPDADQSFTAGPLTVATTQKGEHHEEQINEVPLTIRIIDSVPSPETGIEQPPSKTGGPTPVMMKERIGKKYSGEIISASKYLTYYQCPFKYYLTYISGLAGIPGLEEFFISPEDEPETPCDPTDDNGLAKNEGELPSAPVGNLGAAIGTIVHEYLAAPGDATLLSAVTAITDSLIGDNPTLAKSRDTLIRRPVEILTKYLATTAAKTISGYGNSRNEEELFIWYSDFYLMGVIDKLVILEDRIVIIDYKTDRDPAHSLDRYREQLRFYAYICSKVYKTVNSFELRLVFFSDLEAVQPETVTRAELSAVEEKINSLIKALRGSFASGEFSKNTSHCGECRFSFNTGRCLAHELQE